MLHLLCHRALAVDHDKCPDEDDAIRADLPFNVRFFRPLDSHRTEFFYMNLTGEGTRGALVVLV